jgi:peptidoglycan/xylan/chitin deacetylase (PgdA/CDA1 family)
VEPEPEYLKRLPRYQWPNGARIAVVMQVPFEISAEAAGQTIEGHGSTIVPALPPDILATGERDVLAESMESYGAEVGMWRLIGLLDRHEITGTGVFSGIAAERHPEIADAFAHGTVEREICLHSWGQDVRSYRLDREELRRTIRRCLTAVEAATGVRPVGWVSPGASFLSETIEVLAEEGFLYQGDYANNDSGDVLDVAGRRLVRMSVPWDVNDYFWYAHTFNPPSAFVEAFARTFDILHAEGGQVVAAAVHASVFGRPLGVWALDQCIEYAKGHSDVWFATREAIARCILEQSTVTVPHTR